MKIKVKSKGKTHAERFFLSKVSSGDLVVSKKGIVTNVVTDNVIGTTGSGGYPKISMARSNRKDIVHIQIHRLNWLIRKGDIPDGLIINHIDGNKENPDIDNLEVMTPKGNTKHAVENGLHVGMKGKKNPAVKIDESKVQRYREKYHSGLMKTKEIANECGVSRVTALMMLQGKTFTHIGGPISH